MDDILVPFISNLISFMLILPDDPEGDYLSLFNYLYKVV